MATAGASIALMVVEADATSPAAETAVDVFMQSIVEVGQRQPAPGAVAGTTVAPLLIAPLPQQHAVAVLMPQRHIVARPMAPLMPQQRAAARPMAPPVRLTAAANRMAAANITRR